MYIALKFYPKCLCDSNIELPVGLDFLVVILE